MAGWSPAASPGLASAAAHLSVQMTADLGTEQRLAIARTQHSGTMATRTGTQWPTL